jgi:hypothetical protein
MRFHLGTLALGLALAAPTSPAYGQVANPVLSVMRRMARGSERNIVGSAELMPTEKYVFKPTPDVMTFGEIMAHVADDNNISCGGIAGAGAKPGATPKAADGKDKIVAGLFAFCESVLAKVDDTQLGKNVSYYGSQAPLAAIVIGLPNDWGSHYSQAAVYLRLNGILPPTARKKQ